MGRKHPGQGKHILLFIAGLILFVIAGCTAIIGMDLNRQASENLLRGQKFMENGDYIAAIEENQEAMSIVLKGPTHDKALFNMGLIYAHVNNPDHNYRKSIGYFSDLIHESPESPLRTQAAIWIDMLNALEEAEESIRKARLEIKIIRTEQAETKATNKFLARNLKLLGEENFKGALEENQKILKLPLKTKMGDLVLFNLGLIYAHYGNPDKNYKLSLRFFRKLTGQYPDSRLVEEAKIWIDVLEIIEKSKQVDVEIEKKKKELMK